MIKSAKDKRTAAFLRGERVAEFQAFERQAWKRLRFLDAAARIEDLMAMASNRFEALGGDRKGTFSIAINRQWRICFAFADGNAEEVEIVDYH